jgi:DNA primase
MIAEYHNGVQRELYVIQTAEKLGVSKEVLASDVERVRSKQRVEAKQKESRDLLLSARSFGDRVNPDAAKNPTAASAEETILGLMLLYPEHRKAVADGKIELGEDVFFTSLGKRAFAAILNMETGEDGFSFSALGEAFTPDEMGRLVRIQQDRQALSNNSLDVLADAAQTLHTEYRKRTERESGDFYSELARRRAALQKKKDNHT